MEENLNQPENQGAPQTNQPAKMVKIKIKTKTIILAIVVLGLAAAGVYVYLNRTKLFAVEKCPGEAMAASAAGEAVIKFVNQTFLQGAAQASLKEVVEENCIYKVKINVDGRDFDTYLTRDGKTFFPEAIPLTEATSSAAAANTEPAGTTIGNFSVSKDEICKENNKPLVYFFGSESCPHCRWEKPVFEAVTKKFSDLVSIHTNIDNNKEMEIFSKYSTGGIPTIILGCRYYRVGSGENSGEKEETKALTALICKLTGNQPAAVCNPVKDLVDQIKD